MQHDGASYHEFVSTTLRHTYVATARRMLAETGVRKGVCIDTGCGSRPSRRQACSSPKGGTLA